MRFDDHRATAINCCNWLVALSHGCRCTEWHLRTPLHGWCGLRICPGTHFPREACSARIFGHKIESRDTRPSSHSHAPHLHCRANSSSLTIPGCCCSGTLDYAVQPSDSTFWACCAHPSRPSVAQESGVHACDHLTCAIHDPAAADTWKPLHVLLSEICMMLRKRRDVCGSSKLR